MSSFGPILAPAFEKKICEPALLDVALKRLPRPLVFTNGCFDILHRGHVTYLAQARNLGSSMIVAVNSDDSVRTQNKGLNRPIIPMGDRVSVLASLGAVSLVTWFDEETPLEIIKRIKPNILVKGGDWETDKISGADFVKEYGGQVVSVPILYKRSTTAIIERILAVTAPLSNSTSAQA